MRASSRWLTLATSSMLSCRAPTTSTGCRRGHSPRNWRKRRSSVSAGPRLAFRNSLSSSIRKMSPACPADLAAARKRPQLSTWSEVTAGAGFSSACQARPQTTSSSEASARYSTSGTGIASDGLADCASSRRRLSQAASSRARDGSTSSSPRAARKCDFPEPKWPTTRKPAPVSPWARSRTAPRLRTTSPVSTSSRRRPEVPSSRTTVSAGRTSTRSAIRRLVVRLTVRRQLAKLRVYRSAAAAGDRQQLLEGLPQLPDRATLVLKPNVAPQADHVFGLHHEALPQNRGGLGQAPGLLQCEALHPQGVRTAASGSPSPALAPCGSRGDGVTQVALKPGQELQEVWVVAACALEQKFHLPLPVLGFQLKQPGLDQAGIYVAVARLEVGSALVGALRLSNIAGPGSNVTEHQPGCRIVRSALDRPCGRTARTLQVFQAKAAACQLDQVPARAVAEGVRLTVGGSCLVVATQAAERVAPHPGGAGGDPVNRLRLVKLQQGQPGLHPPELTERELSEGGRAGRLGLQDGFEEDHSLVVSALLSQRKGAFKAVFLQRVPVYGTLNSELR